MLKLTSGPANPEMGSGRPKKNIRFARMQVLVNCICMSCVALGLCFYTSGMFYDSVSAGLGLTASEMSLTTTLYLIALAIGTIILPKLIDRVAYRYLFQIGAVLAVAATLMMSFSFSRVFLYVLCFLQGLGCSMIGLVPVTTILNNWFYRSNDWYTALVLAFPALAASLFGPMFSGVISALGWRMSYVLLAVLAAVFLAWGFVDPVSLTPEEEGLKPFGVKDLEPEPAQSRQSAVNSLIVMVLIALCGACLIGLPLHYSGFMSSIGFDLIIAGRMLAWTMIGNIIFKIGGGLISDKFGVYKTTAGLCLFALIASIGMAVAVYNHNAGALYVLSFLFGSSYAISELSLPLLVKQRFGRLRYMTIYSIVHACSLIMTGLSIYLIGVIVDASHTYLWVWVIAGILIVLIEVLLFWATGGMKPLDSHENLLHKEEVKSQARKQDHSSDQAYEVEPVSADEPTAYESPSFYYDKKRGQTQNNADASGKTGSDNSNVSRSFNASASSIDEEPPYSFAVNTDKDKPAAQEQTSSTADSAAQTAADQSEKKEAAPVEKKDHPGLTISVSDKEPDKPKADFATPAKKPAGSDQEKPEPKGKD